MSFPDHPPPPPYFPPPPFANSHLRHKRAYENGDMDSDPHLDPSQSFKKPQNSMNSNLLVDPPNFPRANQNLGIGMGAGHIFYKTRMCLKFLDGNCRNGENCNFAHGADDLREPPANWREIVNRKDNGNGYDNDQRSTQKLKFCKKYTRGEECPYGESCNFLHKRGAMRFDAEVDECRESSAICIGTYTSLPNQIEDMNITDNKLVNDQNLDVYRVNMKTVYWKTKLCSRWEFTGYCPFGDKCHFAHGHADLKMPGVQIEEEIANILSYNPATKHVFAPTTTTTDINTAIVIPNDNGVKKLNEKWKGPKKINCIYGDWLDDFEPPLMCPKNDTEAEPGIAL